MNPNRSGEAIRTYRLACMVASDAAVALARARQTGDPARIDDAHRNLDAQRQARDRAARGCRVAFVERLEPTS